MTKHMIGTREEWLAARLRLLRDEKELTRRSDELARRRQELPWVRIDKEYRFVTDEGSASLADLFRGRSQLLVYHFMFGPDYQAGCPSCSAIADGFNGFVVHLANHDVMLWAVSRAPLAKLQEYKRRMGWTFPWASSVGGDFNFDFNVSFTEEQQREGGIEYNYRREAGLDEWRAGQEGGGEEAEDKFAAMCGTDAPTYQRERPGISAFVLEDGVVFRLCARSGRPLGHVPVARPRPQGAQRDGRLVAPSRRVRAPGGMNKGGVGGRIMRHFMVVLRIAVTIFVVGEAAAVEQTQKVENAKKKAGVLEKKAAGESPKALPSSAVTIKQAEVQAVDPAGEGALNDAITCLARSIYWEARGEGAAGMDAIANVVMNRLGHQGFPDTVCGVVKQGREQGACQFSWWCDRRSDDAKDDASYALAKEIARKALNRQLPDRIGGALYFHQRNVKPAWSKKYIKTARIGKFIFYKPKGIIGK